MKTLIIILILPVMCAGFLVGLLAHAFCVGYAAGGKSLSDIGAKAHAENKARGRK
jgi:hypothetical protein